MFALLSIMFAFLSCITEQKPVDVYYTPSEKTTSASDKTDSDKPPTAYAQVKKFLSGDTIMLNSGKIVKYAGIECPKKGEPYFKKALKFNKWLIGIKLVKLVWIAGTKRSDAVIKANVLTNVPDLGGVSVPEQLVKNGLAKVVINSPLKFESLDKNGKIKKLTETENKLIFERLINLQRQAKRAKRNIFSGNPEE